MSETIVGTVFIYVCQDCNGFMRWVLQVPTPDPVTGKPAVAAVSHGICDECMVKKPFEVIVKSYGGKPVHMKAIDKGGVGVEVFKDDPAKSLGFPRNLVFPFNKNDFKLLSRAWESRDMDTVESLWKDMERRRR